MNIRARNRALRVGVAASLLVVALAVTAAAPAEAALAHPARAPARTLTASPDASQHRVISYRGHRFTVPVSWPVIRLGRASTTCVRFDRHAVYLGRPPANQDCPARVLGRADALLIQAAPATAARKSSQDPVSHEITSTMAGISVTATYASAPATVTTVLRAARLPVPAATSTQPVTRSAARAARPGAAGLRQPQCRRHRLHR